MKNLAYGALDLVTLKKGITRHISGFEVKVPARYFRYFPPKYELSNISFLDETLSEGMTAIDIGAHIGLLAVIMGKKVGEDGKVLAFEPTPSTFATLEETIKINDLENAITLIRKAVSEKVGMTSFYVTDIEGHNSNSLADNKRDYGNEHKIDVELTSIDEIVEEYKLSKVDLLKIDAEGAEYSVLKGGKKTIEANKPVMSLSLHPSSINNFGDSLDEIWGFIQEHNYKVVYKTIERDKKFFTSQEGLFDVFLV